MDAYSSYIMKMSEARTGELRREAAEYALSRAARGGRASLWARVINRLRRQGTPAVEPAGAIVLRTRRTETEPEVALRRSA